MMASTAVYPSPGRPASWARLPNTHLQEDQYYKQHYQKTSRDFGMQQNFATEQLRSQFASQETSRNTQQPFIQLQNFQNASHPPIRNSSKPFVKSPSDLDKSKLHSEYLPSNKSQESTFYTSQPLTSQATLPNMFARETNPHKMLQSSPCLNTSSSRKPIASNAESLFHKTVKCYTCNKIAKNDHFLEHLFFGIIKCTRCDVVLSTCQKFRTLLVTSIMGDSSCNHTLEYCYDPFDYISARLSGERSPSNGGSLVPPNVLKDLSVYIESLNSLEEKEPWCYAIAKCKNHLPSKITKQPTCKEKESSLSSEESKPHISEVSENTQLQEKCSVSEKRPTDTENSDFSIPTSSTPSKHITKHTDYEMNEGDILLSQSYDLEYLEKTIEYVKVAENSEINDTSASSFPSEMVSVKKKPRSYKRRKAGKTKVDDTEEETESTELYDLPEDGNYLILKTSIEECPMCYSTLCPSRFTVNVETFLMTTACTECNLLIYIVPKGSKTVIINSEEDDTNKLKPSVPVKRKRGRPKVNKPKKKSKSKSHVFFAQ